MFTKQSKNLFTQKSLAETWTSIKIKLLEIRMPRGDRLLTTIRIISVRGPLIGFRREIIPKQFLKIDMVNNYIVLTDIVSFASDLEIASISVIQNKFGAERYFHDDSDSRHLKCWV